jgi:hypothetical protein
MKTLFLIGVAVCLGASGCDSKNPLSNPKTAKADDRLAGTWRRPLGDVEEYYYVGRAGMGVPSGMMRVVRIRYEEGELRHPEDYLIFPTVIGNKTFLNLFVDKGDELPPPLKVEGKDETGRDKKDGDEEGWKAESVDSYTFYKYKLEGDKLTIYAIDEEAKQKAINSGKIKGTIEQNGLGKLTDTAENVAHFVAEAGDSLWNMKRPLHLERMNTDKKP